jgi:hypothetical protein
MPREIFLSTKRCPQRALAQPLPRSSVGARRRAHAQLPAPTPTLKPNSRDHAHADSYAGGCPTKPTPTPTLKHNSQRKHLLPAFAIAGFLVLPIQKAKCFDVHFVCTIQESAFLFFTMQKN